MVICDFYSDQKLIPIKSMSFGKFCTSNFKPVFVEHAAGADSAVSIPLKFITTFMFDYFKGKNLKTDLEIQIKFIYRLCYIIWLHLPPKKRLRFWQIKFLFPKKNFFYLLPTQGNMIKISSNETVNKIYIEIKWEETKPWQLWYAEAIITMN